MSAANRPLPELLLRGTDRTICIRWRRIDSLPSSRQMPRGYAKEMDMGASRVETGVRRAGRRVVEWTIRHRSRLVPEPSWRIPEIRALTLFSNSIEPAEIGASRVPERNGRHVVRSVVRDSSRRRSGERPHRLVPGSRRRQRHRHIGSGKRFHRRALKRALLVELELHEDVAITRR